MDFNRDIFRVLAERLSEPRRFLQVLLGPRQIGKTTGVTSVLDRLPYPSHLASVDEALSAPPQEWIRAQWEQGRELARSGPAVLVLDEIQKIPQWSVAVKGLWDQDARDKRDLRVVLLGSSTLLIHEGLSESLAGRFEVLRPMHWSLPEMRDAFGYDVDRYVFFGGYPGGAGLVADTDRWRSYVRESIVETTITRDVLWMTRVDKPALLRALFELACAHASQVVSYTKLLGQLQDRGNTATLAHYVELLERAGLVAGIQKYAGDRIRSRGSSPKLLPLNTGLVSALASGSLDEARANPALWGRLVETTVGAHLYNTSIGTPVELTWWRERNHEIDFVLRRGPYRTAIEVKTGAKGARWKSFDAFRSAHGEIRPLVVGTEGIALEEFLARPASSWVGPA